MNDECGLVAAISAFVDVGGFDPDTIGATIYDVVITFFFALDYPFDAFAADEVIFTRGAPSADFSGRPHPVARACGSVTDAVLVFAFGCPGIAYTAGGTVGTNCGIRAGYFGRPRPVARACGN